MMNTDKPNISGSTPSSAVEYHLLLAPVLSALKGVWVLCTADAFGNLVMKL